MANGSVLGIDVGWSTRRKSSAVCLLHWDSRDIDWEIRRFRATEAEREEAIRQTAGDRVLAAVAIDGPLRWSFDEIGLYRSADRILTYKEIRERIGKPGQSSSPNGRKLNRQANFSAELVEKQCLVKTTSSPVRIASHAIVEAFPTSFLGVMIDRPEELCRPRHRSDRYFKHLAGTKHFDHFLDDLLPGLRAAPAGSIKDHDDRAAFVCALTALCVAKQDFTAVGDRDDGWIVLPPKRHFARWAWEAICRAANAENEDGQFLQVGPEGAARCS